MGEPAVQALVALVAALESTDEQTRYTAAFTLAERGDRRALPVVQAALKEASESIRSQAEHALDKIVQAKARQEHLTALVAEYSPQLSDPQESRQFQAAKILAEASVEEGFMTLIHLLHFAKAKSIRVMAASALEAIGDVRAVEPLIEALRDPQRDVRRFAAAALATFADPRAILPLVGALTDPEDLDTRLHAVSALQKIGEPARPHVLPLLESSDKAHSLVAAAVLGKYGGEEPFLILVEALNEPRPGFAHLAIWALAATGNPRAVDVLIKVLDTDSREFARRAAASWLGEIGDARALRPLTERFDDPDKWVRNTAKEAFQKVRHRNQ
jgi:HEAT repeat protein